MKDSQQTGGIITDIGRLLELLDKWSVPYRLHSHPTGTEVIMERDNLKDDVKVLGYHGFLVEFSFNPDGSFRHIGIWE